MKLIAGEREVGKIYKMKLEFNSQHNRDNGIEGELEDVELVRIEDGVYYRFPGKDKKLYLTTADMKTEFTDG